MIAWSTPTLRLRVKGADLTDWEVHVTIEQQKPYGVVTSVTIDDADLTKELDGEDTIVTVTPTQAQTGKFSRGVAAVQVNAVSSDGERLPTLEAPISIYRNLIDHALTYGGGDA